MPCKYLYLAACTGLRGSQHSFVTRAGPHLQLLHVSHPVQEQRSVCRAEVGQVNRTSSPQQALRLLLVSSRAACSNSWAKLGWLQGHKLRLTCVLLIGATKDTIVAVPGQKSVILNGNKLYLWRCVPLRLASPAQVPRLEAEQGDRRYQKEPAHGIDVQPRALGAACIARRWRCGCLGQAS